MGVCTARRYAYNDRAERTLLVTAASGTATCADQGNPGTAPVSTVGYTYDSADRLVSDTGTGAAGWVYDPLGRITNAPVRGNPGARVANSFFANDLVASQTIPGVARSSWSLDPVQRLASFTSQAWAAGADGQLGWQQAVTRVNHYDSDGDSPSWLAEDASLPGEVTRFVDGLDANMAVQTGKAGGRVLQLVDLHGDVMGTVPIGDGAPVADWSGLAFRTADEFGIATDLTTGGARASTGAPPGRDDRYGWLGGKQRSTEALAGVVLMGVRLYDPGTGRFWQTDPVPGGNSTTYDYCSGDPVHCTDLDGRWSWRGVLKKVAVIAEVASIIPGPIGAVAGAISAGAYAATDNRTKAFEMGVTAAASMVGAGAAVKVGYAAARSSGRVAARVGRAVVKSSRSSGCNSFKPETPFLMADGTTLPISQVQVGDLVASRDPATGELSAQPVLNTIVGVGDKHLIVVTTAAAVAEIPDAAALADTWVATANHPIWIDGNGWTDAVNLHPGDHTSGVTGDLRTVTAVIDQGWVHDQTVYNLTVASVHTYLVGDEGDGTLVHNAASCSITSGGTFSASRKAYVWVQNAAKNKGSNICEKCGISVAKPQRLTRGQRKDMTSEEVDHIIPRSKGGNNNPATNGRLLCARCNLQKSNRNE